MNWYVILLRWGFLVHPQLQATLQLHVQCCQSHGNRAFTKCMSVSICSGAFIFPYSVSDKFVAISHPSRIYLTLLCQSFQSLLLCLQLQFFLKVTFTIIPFLSYTSFVSLSLTSTSSFSLLESSLSIVFSFSNFVSISAFHSSLQARKDFVSA